MTNHEATEQAYKNGYEKGKADALKWTSVKEGLPALIPCGAGTAYSEAVNVLTTGDRKSTRLNSNHANE